MTHARRLVLSALFALGLAACAHSGAQAPATPRVEGPPITILISLDGFRPDYLDRGETPTLTRLANEGVRASMRPSFPSVTFPNHYTLVTGLRPGRHGVINNRMEDPERPGVVFTLPDRAVAADPIWWRDGAPIWVTAENQGVRTGTMFWPGSDYELHGRRPSRWRTFDQSLPGFARVDILLSWLDLPAAERPSFYTLYFDLVDTAGHRYGPDALETNAAAADRRLERARLCWSREFRHRRRSWHGASSGRRNHRSRHAHHAAASARHLGRPVHRHRATSGSGAGCGAGPPRPKRARRMLAQERTARALRL
jgi:hypothetical protein